MEKKSVRDRCFRFLGSYDEAIRTKFSNICGKTGMYNVPIELYQKRTSRKNRVLLSWRAVKNNGLTMEMLNSFEGGVAVEFLNNDYFSEEDKNNALFIELKNRIGSNEKVSSIISFRTEAGSSSSQISRDALAKFLDGTKVNYQGEEIIINKSNYMNYVLTKSSVGGQGNDIWSGFLFICIKGGQQDTIETHKDNHLTLFNPACEYASEDVCIDIDLTLSYFALMSIDRMSLDSNKLNTYNKIIEDLENVLKNLEYDFNGKRISLYTYVTMHPSTRIRENELTDPIQLKPIDIYKFAIKDNSGDSIDLTHNEAVNIEKYYWDSENKRILSPARPTNVFWSYHLSNMMQQDFNLAGYLEYEEEVYKKRQEFKELYEFIQNF